MTSIIPIHSDADLTTFCSLPGMSELTPETIAHHRPDESWAVVDGGEMTARCSLWWTAAPPMTGQRVGAIGHYFAGDAANAGRMLDHASRRLADQHCTVAVAPMDGNTWRRYRLLTERGDQPPFFMEPDNRDDWPTHFTDHGFAPLVEYYSAVNDNLSQVDPRSASAMRHAEANSIGIRSIDMRRFEDELRSIHALSVVSFTNNFLYTRIEEEEFVAQYRGVRELVRPEFVLLAEQGERLVGFLFIVPDLLQAKRGQPIDTVIFKTMAVHPKHRGAGLGGLLMGLGHDAARRLGYRRAIHALMHADNHSRRISNHVARIFRRYTLYSRPLGVSS